MIPETQKPLPDTPSLPDTPPLPPDNDVGADAFGIDVVDTEKAEYTYAEMVEDLSLLKKRYGDKMSYETIGTSLDGRSIYAVTLGNPNAENQIIISAGIHAREYMTPMLVMAQLEHYLYYYDTESFENIPLSEIFEEYSFCILPMCNPDGITLAEMGLDGIRSEELRETILGIYELDKVKFAYTGTFDEYLSEWKANARGVDLNRNFDTEDFGSYPTMSRPCFMNHPGENPLSEPETRAMTEYVKSLKNPVLSIAVHSQGEVIYFNCGQDNFDESKELASKLSEWTGYELDDEVKYSSAFDDWCNKVMNIPSATVETGKSPCPLPIGEFDKIWQDNRDLWLLAALYHKGK
jgi:g-D-glutamyl-meso-diaminopimelate peptidase